MMNRMPLIFFILCLSGCFGQTTLEMNINSYAERIARVTQSEISPPPPDLKLYYPKASERKVTIPSTTLNLREFYAINGCPLATLVAQRNTTLGKVEAPELRYAYERQLLQTLSQCGELIQSDNIDLMNELSRLQTVKTKNLPLAFADLLQNSNAIVTGLSFSSEFIGTEQTISEITQSIAAIHYLANIDSDQKVDISEMNEHLQTLEQRQVWAKIWRTQRYIIQVLPNITTVLNDYRKGLNCRATQGELDILRNVMMMFFIDYVQPLASTIIRAQEQSSEAWQTLLDKPSIESSMKAFITSHTQEQYQAFKDVLNAHVKSWQALFAQCSISPTGDKLN